MSSDILIERDILYPTDSSIEPGSIHIQVFSPDKNAKIPLEIESKTRHFPLKYIDTIMRIIQSDIFDRIFIDMRKNVDIYIKTNAETATEYGNHSHIKLSFFGDRVESEGVDR